METNRDSQVDVPVLCIFFARPEEFRRVFEQVRRARPRVLLLWQDGPRADRPDDFDNITQCRQIAEEIDWDCEVHRNYHDLNMGCDPSTHLAHKWAFTLVDKCIILEDDVVVDTSFFRFCKELLDRFEEDERIDRICGMNHLEKFENGYSYLFQEFGSSTGWATWRRVANSWETDYAFLSSEYFMELVRRRVNDKSHAAYEAETRKECASGVPHWEKIVSFAMLLNSRLVITPTKNMVHCIGASKNATHATADIMEIPNATRQMFDMKTYDTSFPLRHPPYVVPDSNYVNEVRRRFFPRSRAVQYFRGLSSVVLRVRSGNWASLHRGFQRRLALRGHN